MYHYIYSYIIIIVAFLFSNFALIKVILYTERERETDRNGGRGRKREKDRVLKKISSKKLHFTCNSYPTNLPFNNPINFSGYKINQKSGDEVNTRAFNSLITGKP